MTTPAHELLIRLDVDNPPSPPTPKRFGGVPSKSTDDGTHVKPHVTLQSVTHRKTTVECLKSGAESSHDEQSVALHDTGPSRTHDEQSVALHDTGPSRYHVERLTVRRVTIRRLTIKSLDGRLSISDCHLPTSDWPSGNMWVDMSPAVSRLAWHSPKLLVLGRGGGLSTSGFIKSAWDPVVILHLQLVVDSL